ncbi:MAG: HAD-IC family P-type ATPase [Planctomycetota bacterium]|nr:HAD-IC family P-type ATPase [Planctomycetota bacterium]
MEQWHHLNLDQVFGQLGASTAGLSSEEAANRLAKHGPNELIEKQKTPAWRRFLRQFMSPVIYVLLAAAVIALALQEYKDAGIIIGVLVINATIGFIHEGKAERAMAALKKMTAPFATVMRGAKETVVPARELVPGDILVVHAGDRLAADARVVEAVALQTLEGSLTGESTGVSKRVLDLPEDTPLADRRNMLYKGTIAVTGRGAGIVVSTGMNTELGRIARMVQEAKEPKTNLQRRLEQLGRAIIVCVCALIVVVFGLGMLRSLPMREMLMVAISQAVSAIPEDLPVAMTIALAVGMQRMARRKAVVRRLAAVETLGGVTVICSDKTGTLTKNEMTVVEIWAPDCRVAVTGAGYEPTGKFLVDGKEEMKITPGSPIYEILQCAALCNDSHLVPSGKDSPCWGITGDPTEGALAVAAAKAGMDVEDLRANAPRVWEVPFDAVSRLMATGHRTRAGKGDYPASPGGNAGEHVVYLKGAPESVIGLCSMVRRGGNDEHVDDAVTTAVAEAQEEMARNALRVLGFAGARLDTSSLEAGFESLRGKMVFLGLAGEVDPPRPEVRDAIELCKKAGVRTVMVTGDHLATGKAIGDALAISETEARAIDGVQLAKMSQQELDEAVKTTSVFARVAPEQKVRLVETFQRLGEVVAMTGDGVNDAPALVQADIGVAMGITGTEVTKEAAAMVITDDNFVTIVSAIEEGRVIFNNLRKTIMYLLSTNVAEMVALMSSLASGLPIPLRAAQILWVNLVTDGTLTVNLVMEKREGDEMKNPPIRREEPLVSLPSLIRMLFLVPIMAFGTIGLFAWELHNNLPLEHAQTAAFTLLVVFQWFNALNSRSGTRSILAMGLFSNPFVIAGISAAVIMQLGAIYLPFMQRLMGTVPLSLIDWIRIVALGSMVIVVDEFYKWYLRKGAEENRSPLPLREG